MQIKENIKAPRHWPLCGEFTGTGEFPAQRASYAEMFPFDDVIMNDENVWSEISFVRLFHRADLQISPQYRRHSACFHKDSTKNMPISDYKCTLVHAREWNPPKRTFPTTNVLSIIGVHRWALCVHMRGIFCFLISRSRNGLPRVSLFSSANFAWQESLASALDDNLSVSQ